MVDLADAALHPALASGHYFHWGVVQISLANLLIIIAMVVVFVLALVIPFPGGRADSTREEGRHDHD
jgi:hypothetical protein